MELFLIRHAPAVDSATDDASRRLSPRGRERFAHTVAGLDALGTRFAHVLHSPLIRAVETAELCRPLCDGQLESCDELAVAPGNTLLERIQGVRLSSIALVGHEPWMSDLFSLLVSGDANLATHFPFKKGALHDWRASLVRRACYCARSFLRW